MLRVKWGKRAFRIFVRQWKTKHPSQPYNFYSGHPTLRWPAFFLPRARMRWAFFKKKLSPFTTLVYKGIAAIWRFTKVSHCFHTQNKVWARGCVARERSWYGDETACLMYEISCLVEKRWALFRKRWAFAGKSSPFHRKNSYLATGMSYPVTGMSYPVNGSVRETSVKAMWNVGPALPCAGTPANRLFMGILA